MTPRLLRTVVGIVIHDGNTLIFQRPKTSHAYGLWCFPGGKVEQDETVPQALVREIHEEVGIHIKEYKEVLLLTGFQNNQDIALHVYHIVSYTSVFTNPEAHIWTWSDQQQLEEYPTFKINLRIVEYLNKYPLPETRNIPH